MQNNLLFKTHGVDFRLSHLLIIGILTICFIVSFGLRSQVADYGFVLNETDPYYNFRATEFLVENGIESYINWHDDLSWHPDGRDVFETSQVALHLTAGFLYKIFGFGMSLNDFTIFFPAVISSLTSIIIFALVRVMAGTTAGLFASLFFSVSPLIIVRGSLGWFKSEPLGFFYSLLAIYLLFSVLKTQDRKTGFFKLVLAGFLLGISFSAWGGSQLFVIPIGLFIISLPFFRKDHNFLLWTIPLFVSTAVLFSSILSRAGIDFLTQFGSFGLIGPTVFLVILVVIQKLSKKHSLRNSLIFLLVSVFSGIGIIFSNLFSLPASIRYTIALNPFVERDPLVESVAEHAIRNLEPTFVSMSILLPLAGLGIWLVMRNGKKSYPLNISLQNEFLLFALILGMLGVYVGATLSRLLVFSAISVIIFAAIGLAVLTLEIFRRETKESGSESKIISLLFAAAAVYLLLLPVGFLPNTNWISITDIPPPILNGNSDFKISTPDWLATNEWIRMNTPEDSVVAAWWDWGYWITTLSERKTLADNAAFPKPVIPKLAQMFLSSQEDGYQILRELDADYVLVSVVGEKKVVDGKEFYELKKGGDNGKVDSMIKISREDPSKFLIQNIVPNKNFWENTVLGTLIPFTPTVIAELVEYESLDDESTFTIFYEKTSKIDVEGNVPFKLVYSSPGLNQEEGIFVGVLVYEINKDYSLSD